MPDLDRESFSLDLIRDISGTLEDVVGLQEAEGYFALVGHHMGARLHDRYCAALGRAIETPEIAGILTDLKARIGGSFVVESADDSRITFVNRDCPFGARVVGRRSLCMMTSNVFGFISAEVAGYAKVALQNTIAAGDGHCRVVVHLVRTDADGREYYGQHADRS
jgi:predicted ArsR family transcriptional regulator